MEKTTDKFECSTCKSKFIRQSFLQDHLLTHESNRVRLPCVCGVEFTLKKNLIRHQRAKNHHQQIAGIKQAHAGRQLPSPSSSGELKACNRCRELTDQAKKNEEIIAHLTEENEMLKARLKQQSTKIDSNTCRPCKVSLMRDIAVEKLVLALQSPPMKRSRHVALIKISDIQKKRIQHCK